jgi:hypothetical protein
LREEVLPANWPTIEAYWVTLLSSIRDPPVAIVDRFVIHLERDVGVSTVKEAN